MSSNDKFEIIDNLKQDDLQNNSDQTNLEDKKRSNNKKNWITKLKHSKNTKKLDIKGDFNLEAQGTIEFAKLHKNANRPLKKIQEFDEHVEFCPCCSLPRKQKGYLEEFHFNDDTDNFTLCGTGIPLYFSFFRFCLLILIFSSITISLPTVLLTNYYTSQLIDTCMKLYNDNDVSVDYISLDCINFIGIEGESKFFINGSDWALRFNGINLRQYRFLHFHLTQSNQQELKSTLVDYSFIYFLTLISLFILNMIYILFIYNINKRNDMLVTTPGDYTVIISNLYYAFEIFFNKINKINRITAEIKKNNIINKNDNNIGILKEQNINNFYSKKNKVKIKEIENLGLEAFPQDQEINILEGFNTFIKNRICVSFDGEKFNVSHINICYKIDELKKTEDQIQEKKSKILKIKNDPKQQLKNELLNLKDNERMYFAYLISIYGINVLPLGKCKSIKLSKIEEEQLKLENKLNTLLEQSKNLTKENFAGVIFVTFNTKKDKEKFLSPYPNNLIMFLLISVFNLRYYFCGCLIHKSKRRRFFLKRNMTVEGAPEPDEVQFENLQFSSYERFCRTLSVYFISIIIIGISFIIISRLNVVQKNLKSDINSILIKYGVSLIITIVTSIINVVFQMFLEILTKMEKHINMTNYYLSFSIKLTLFTFITSSIIPLASNYIYNNGDCDLLVTNMLVMFLSNSFVTPIMWTLNFKYFLKKIIQFIFERKKNHYCTQRELNNLYELPDMKISYKYSYLAKTLLMSFLYIPIFPLGIFISLLGFILGYFLEKYNFVKMYKRPEMLNSNLCEFYSNYFVLNFFMLGLGNYLFTSDNNDNDFWSLFIINLFGILMIIPYNQILICDFIGINESQLKNTKTYDEEYFNFYNDYERSNPMTKKEGMKRFIYKLKEKKYINNIDEAILININNINLMEVYYKSKKNFNNSLIQRSFALKNGKRPYENILRQFARGNTFKNLIQNAINKEKGIEIENEKEKEKEESKNAKDSITIEENIKSSINDTDGIKPVHNLIIKNLITSYTNNMNPNENNSSRNLNDDTINNIINSSKEYKNKNNKNLKNNKVREGSKNSLLFDDNKNEINLNNNIILEFEEKKNNENSYEKNDDIKNKEKKENKIINENKNPFHFFGLSKMSGYFFNNNSKKDIIKEHPQLGKDFEEEKKIEKKDI